MTLYLDSLRPLLPDDIRKQLDHALLPEVKVIVDALLRLAVGAEAPSNVALPGWQDLQPRASKIVDDLKRGEQTRSSQKRSRDDDPASSSKRARTGDDSPAEDDLRVYSLHGISVSTPIRKKVNIDVHRSTIRLMNPSSQKEEYPPIPLAVLQRAFLLPTRGKSKPHWTVVLLSSDVPPPVPKGPAAAKETTTPQLVFGLDATLTSVLTTTTSNPDSSKTYAKGQPSLPALRAFLSNLPIPALEPSTSVFRSALGGGGSGADGGGTSGVEAYRGAKEGTLWFLDGGVLWDGKPCEFFALEHIAPSQKGGDQPPVDGVRTLSATGRTCSVIVRRIGGGSPAKETGKGKGANGKGKGSGTGEGETSGDDDDEQEDEGVEIDFGMVDGREQEPIGRWIKARRHLFGRTAAPTSAAAGASGSAADSTGPGVDKGKGKAKAREADPRNEDTEDEEDSDFEMGSSDDVGSGSEDSDSDSDASRGDAESDGEGNASDEVTGDEADDDDEDDIVELDPKQHPLLRPGAMPRMSRAAVEAVVGMVEQDMMGVGRAVAEDDDDEEDELDD